EETKAVCKPEGEGEGSELGNLLRAWDRASPGAREKFKARVGLVAVEPPVKVMDDGLDIPECLRRGAPWRWGRIRPASARRRFTSRRAGSSSGWGRSISIRPLPTRARGTAPASIIPSAITVSVNNGLAGRG